MHICQRTAQVPIREFSSIFPDTPGRTQVAYHDVDVGQVQPVKQYPYKVNPVKWKVICEKVKYMLDNGLIEPSGVHHVFWCINQMEVTDSLLTLGE